MMIWPFNHKHRTPSRKDEIEALKGKVSLERNELYKNLVKLDDATKSIETAGVRVMLGEMFRQIDSGKSNE